MKDIYASLGVKRRINAAETLSRLGGALMDALGHRENGDEEPCERVDRRRGDVNLQYAKFAWTLNRK